MKKVYKMSLVLIGIAVGCSLYGSDYDLRGYLNEQVASIRSSMSDSNRPSGVSIVAQQSIDTELGLSSEQLSEVIKNNPLEYLLKCTEAYPGSLKASPSDIELRDKLNKKITQLIQFIRQVFSEKPHPTEKPSQPIDAKIVQQLKECSINIGGYSSLMSLLEDCVNNVVRVNNENDTAVIVTSSPPPPPPLPSTRQPRSEVTNSSLSSKSETSEKVVRNITSVISNPHQAAIAAAVVKPRQATAPPPSQIRSQAKQQEGITSGDLFLGVSRRISFGEHKAQEIDRASTDDDETDDQEWKTESNHYNSPPAQKNILTGSSFNTSTVPDKAAAQIPGPQNLKKSSFRGSKATLIASQEDQSEGMLRDILATQKAKAESTESSGASGITPRGTPINRETKLSQPPVDATPMTSPRDSTMTGVTIRSAASTSERANGGRKFSPPPVVSAAVTNQLNDTAATADTSSRANKSISSVSLRPESTPSATRNSTPQSSSRNSSSGSTESDGSSISSTSTTSFSGSNLGSGNKTSSIGSKASTDKASITNSLPAQPVSDASAASTSINSRSNSGARKLPPVPGERALAETSNASGLARSTGPQRNSNDPSTRGAAQGNGIGNNSQPKAAVNNPPQSGESNSKLKKEGLQLKRVLVVSSLVGLGAWAFKIYYWDQKYEYQRDISVAA